MHAEVWRHLATLCGSHAPTMHHPTCKDAQSAACWRTSLRTCAGRAMCTDPWARSEWVRWRARLTGRAVGCAHMPCCLSTSIGAEIIKHARATCRSYTRALALLMTPRCAAPSQRLHATRPTCSSVCSLNVPRSRVVARVNGDAAAARSEAPQQRTQPQASTSGIDWEAKRRQRLVEDLTQASSWGVDDRAACCLVDPRRSRMLHGAAAHPPACAPPPGVCHPFVAHGPSRATPPCPSLRPARPAADWGRSTRRQRWRRASVRLSRWCLASRSTLSACAPPTGCAHQGAGAAAGRAQACGVWGAWWRQLGVRACAQTPRARPGCVPARPPPVPSPRHPLPCRPPTPPPPRGRRGWCSTPTRRRCGWWRSRRRTRGLTWQRS